MIYPTKAATKISTFSSNYKQLPDDTSDRV